MQPATEPDRAHTMRGIEHLEALRDEVRLRLHLGSMDLHDEWERIEKELYELRTAAKMAGEVSLEAVNDLGRRLRGIRDRLA